MLEDAFFVAEGDSFVPQPVCRGPWDPNSLHGRVISGLLGAEIERLYGDPAFQFTRMNVDLWRLPDFTPIEVRTELLREGGRIKVVSAEAFAGEKSLGRATGVLLRRGEQPEDEVWSPPAWDMAPPLSYPPSERPENAPKLEPMWETRGPGPVFGEAVRKRVWMREVRTLVAGRPLTPWQRVALAVDFTSPLANSGAKGLDFINTDITVYLHRDPIGEWIGFDVATHHSTEGVAFGECAVYAAFTARGKAVFNAEYDRRFRGGAARAALCRSARAANLRTLVLPRDLDDSFRLSCDPD
ncbi:MAG: thioesterase family protein [Verrucomicrobiae bacterium]|nr:thioesterase family protein [Verrucomicrobiae bacterium]